MRSDSFAPVTQFARYWARGKYCRPSFGSDLQTGTTTGSMSTARIKHSPTLLQNGQVLVSSGVNATGFLAPALRCMTSAPGSG